jgi:hypothetical protein
MLSELHEITTYICCYFMKTKIASNDDITQSAALIYAVKVFAITSQNTTFQIRAHKHCAAVSVVLDSTFEHARAPPLACAPAAAPGLQC